MPLSQETSVITDRISKVYPWSEINKHNKYNDCWMVIRGKVYDVTSWVPKHPGGKLILNGAGRESTPLFMSYHPLRVNQLLEKYEIGRVDAYSPFYDWNSEFYTVLKGRVEEYKKKNNLECDSYTMYFKTFLIIFGWIVSYYYAMFCGVTLAAPLLAFFHSHFGISIGHDALHGGYSKKAAITNIFGRAMDFMGASSIVWYHQHNIGHHPHSNIDKDDIEYDPDARSGAPIVRLSPHQPWRPYHRFQHIYLWFLIALMSFKWYVNDIRSVRRRRYMTIDFFEILKSDVVIMLMYKALFLVYLFILPMILLPVGKALLHSLIVVVCSSYYLVMMFAVNHLTDMVEFPNESKINRDWAQLQVETSTNFATDSILWTWLAGGLNFQIEHHLFPSLCHVYLPMISPIVKKTCEEFNVNYVSFPTYWDAVKGHYNHVKQLGVGPTDTTKKSN